MGVGGGRLALGQAFFDTKYYLTCPAVTAAGNNFAVSNVCAGATDGDVCTLRCNSPNVMVGGRCT
jgi:hypothetical protein